MSRFPLWLGKKYGRSDSMNISGEVWFEVYQYGTPYCAINNKKKRTRDKQKNHSTFDRPVKFREKMSEKMYTYLTELCYVYLCLRVYNHKRKMNHRIMEYGFRAWFMHVTYGDLYFLLLMRNSTSSFFGLSSRPYKNKKKNLICWFTLSAPIYIKLHAKFFSLLIFSHSFSQSILILLRIIANLISFPQEKTLSFRTMVTLYSSPPPTYRWKKIKDLVWLSKVNEISWQTKWIGFTQCSIARFFSSTLSLLYTSRLNAKHAHHARVFFLSFAIRQISPSLVRNLRRDYTSARTKFDAQW